jgi:hypothetical protein
MAALRRGIVAFALIVVAPLATRAADIPLIRVFPPECPSAPVSADDFIDALRVELAGRQPHCCVVGPGGDPANDAVKVTLSIEPCDPATQQVRVAVDVASPPRTVQRQVSLADLPPEARPRALALAVAELIRSAGESPGPEIPPPPPASPEAGPAQDRLLLTGTVAGEMESHFAHGTTLWGPRLGLSVSSARWQLTLDAGASASRKDVSLGELSILVASSTLFGGPRFALGPVIASVGPAGTVGWARITGRSNMPVVAGTSGSNVVGTVGLRAAAEGPAATIVRALAYIEAGWTVRWLDADVNGQTSAGISGAYLLLAAGIRFGPGERSSSEP